MAIHHATVRKAEKIGVTLTEKEDDRVVAFWLKRAVLLTGSSASDAMTQMQAVQALDGMHILTRVVDEGRTAHFESEAGEWLQSGPCTPFEAHQTILKGKDVWGEKPESDGGETSDDVANEADDGDGDSSDDPADNTAVATVERSEAGVALDGAIAYREGTPAGDNPFTTETEDEEEYARAVAWDEAWDAAADEATEEDGSKGGSVVSEKYRAKYAELGHPTHCGDWLAELLNNLCLSKEGTDLERFGTICQANGVDTSKYRRSGVGWQGRIRMTGRNLLAKKVYLAGGVVKTPVEGAEPEYRAPADWMASQRFKMPAAEQAKPVPQPQTEPAE